MEADWEFEVGGDAPVIEAYWSGFVDLRSEPERVSELIECCELPALADALIRLNGADSPVWTSKTDVFTPDHIDPDEMSATPKEAVHSVACYIDLLLRNPIWDSAAAAERDCKTLCANLRSTTLRCCRADIVVRTALVADKNGLGATVYLTACGPTLLDANVRLGEALAAFAELFVPLGDGNA
jgi:hypothetical protein